MEKVSEVATFQGFSDPPVSVSELAQTFKLQKPISLSDLLERANAHANEDSMTPLLLSGEAGTKVDLAILGDGFAAGDDQTIYNNAVKDLVLHGVFSNDFFLENKSAFNIYRVNLISHDSGVGTRKYSRDSNDICQEDSTLINTVTKNTALGIYANGCWGRCWHDRKENTDALKKQALENVPDYDFVLIILNTPLFAGCGGGGEAIVSPSGGWEVIAHEFGHSIGGLADEYCVNDEYNEDEPDEVNVTINTNRDTLKWKSYLDPAIKKVPTGIQPDPPEEDCIGFNQGIAPNYWDDNQSVGLFEGAYTFKRGIYRPVICCRMRHDGRPFCPVCYDQMKSALKESGHTENAASSADTSAGYVRFKIHVENGKLSITGVKDIPGKLITPRTASPGHFYEVLIGDEPISLGFLPDIGVRRSYASSNELRVKLREHKSTQPSFDFFVRIPRAKVTEETLPKMAVTVHRVKKMPVKLDRSIPFIKNPGIVSTEIGHLKGVKLNKLPKQVRPQLERILKENVMQK
ncbi:MAG TPA: M64 family metallopeptidase [Methanothrix sp.]|nr:M64 family metallopeptidase [Methanothrix sp.]HPR66690.1 M64 family metallopeptidase [Methanothrix sp.]